MVCYGIFWSGQLVNTKLRKKLGLNSVPQNNLKEQFDATLTQFHAETRLDYQPLFTKISPCLPVKVSFRGGPRKKRKWNPCDTKSWPKAALSKKNP